jgi:hypothetical protein
MRETFFPAASRRHQVNASAVAKPPPARGAARSWCAPLGRARPPRSGSRSTRAGTRARRPPRWRRGRARSPAVGPGLPRRGSRCTGSPRAACRARRRRAPRASAPTRARPRRPGPRASARGGGPSTRPCAAPLVERAVPDREGHRHEPGREIELSGRERAHQHRAPGAARGAGAHRHARVAEVGAGERAEPPRDAIAASGAAVGGALEVDGDRQLLVAHPDVRETHARAEAERQLTAAASPWRRSRRRGAVLARVRPLRGPRGRGRRGRPAPRARRTARGEGLPARRSLSRSVR